MKKAKKELRCMHPEKRSGLPCKFVTTSACALGAHRRYLHGVIGTSLGRPGHKRRGDIGLKHYQFLNYRSGYRVCRLTPTIVNLKSGLVMTPIEVKDEVGTLFRLAATERDSLLTSGLDHRGNAYYMEVK